MSRLAVYKSTSLYFVSCRLGMDAGDDEEEDGCPRDEVPLGSDRCAQLLSSNPCPYRHWVLLNSDTRTVSFSVWREGMATVTLPLLVSSNAAYFASFLIS